MYCHCLHPKVFHFWSISACAQISVQNVTLCSKHVFNKTLMMYIAYFWLIKGFLTYCSLSMKSIPITWVWLFIGQWSVIQIIQRNKMKVSLLLRISCIQYHFKRDFCVSYIHVQTNVQCLWGNGEMYVGCLWVSSWINLEMIYMTLSNHLFESPLVLCTSLALRATCFLLVLPPLGRHILTN